jgi:DNA-binding NarL/FixJ family response regulator
VAGTHASRQGRYPAGGGAPDRRIRVLIVEDHRMFAEAVAKALATVPDMTVVGSAATVEEGRRLVRETHPDVVLMDYRLPDGTGTRAAQQICAERASTRVVIVTASDDDVLLLEAVDAGCSGYVVKTKGLEELVNATRAAAAGDAVIPPALLRGLVARLNGAAGTAPFGLTSREIEVLRLMAQGASNRGISEDLGISLNTTRNHVQSIIRKCDAHSKLEAVSTALREGVIPSPAPRRGPAPPS